MLRSEVPSNEYYPTSRSSTFGSSQKNLDVKNIMNDYPDNQSESVASAFNGSSDRRRYKYRDKASDVLNTNIELNEKANQEAKQSQLQKAKDYHFTSPFGYDFAPNSNLSKFQSSYSSTYGNSNNTTENMSHSRGTSGGRSVLRNKKSEYDLNEDNNGAPINSSSLPIEDRENIFIHNDTLKTPEERRNSVINRQKLENILSHDETSTNYTTSNNSYGNKITQNDTSESYKNVNASGYRNRYNGANSMNYQLTAPFATISNTNENKKILGGNNYMKSSYSSNNDSMMKASRNDVKSARTVVSEFDGEDAKRAQFDVLYRELLNSNDDNVISDLEGLDQNLSQSEVLDVLNEAKTKQMTRENNIYKDDDDDIMKRINQANKMNNQIYHPDNSNENMDVKVSTNPEASTKNERMAAAQNQLQQQRQSNANLKKNHNYSDIFNLAPVDDAEESKKHHMISSKSAKNIGNTYNHIFGNEDDKKPPFSNNYSSGTNNRRYPKHINQNQSNIFNNNEPETPLSSSRQHYNQPILDNPITDGSETCPMTTTYNSMNEHTDNSSLPAVVFDDQHVCGLSSEIINREFKCKSRKYNPKNTSQILF